MQLLSQLAKAPLNLKVRPWACHGYGTTVCLPEADTEWAINQPQSAWTTKSEVCSHAHQPLRLPSLEGLGERKLVCTLPIPACRIGNIHASPMGGQANSDIHSCACTQEKCNQQAPVPELPYVIYMRAMRKCMSSLLNSKKPAGAASKQQHRWYCARQQL